MNIIPTSLNVLHVVDSLKVGGAQTFLMDLLVALDQDIVNKCHLASLYGPGPLQAFFEQRGIQVHNLSGHRGSPFLVPRLKRIIAENQIDVVHAHLVPSCLVLEIFRNYLGVKKCVMHVHNLAFKHRTNRYRNLLERFIYRRCDLLIGCSKAVLKNCPTGTKQVVLYNGINIERLRNDKSIGEDVRATFGISKEAFLVGMVGRLVPQKNPRLLLEAAALIQSKIPDLKIVFVGDGVERGALQTQAASLGLTQSVIFAGTRTNVFDYLTALDVFVLPSDIEGMPVALVEAMSAGVCPIVASFDSAKEVVTPNQTGICVDRGNPKQLAKALIRVHDAPSERQAIAEAAQKEALGRFTIDITARRLESLYIDLFQID